MSKEQGENTEKRMEIVYKGVGDLIPYEKNPRNNEQAVDKVANSIREFGFKVPIVVDKYNVVVCGHTRLKAAKKLGLAEVPCVYADDLTDQQIKAYRIADFLEKELGARGVYVVCEGVHFCMTSRGIRKQDASMITSAIRGVFETNAQARNEFLNLIK